jgi:murein DD-endopeptidase MepM/ murein hydrolase activator NlpD
MRGASLLLVKPIVWLRLAAFFFCSVPLAAAAGSWKVSWQPPRLVNGSPLIFEVSPPQRMESLTGRWLNHQVFFSFNSSHKLWLAVAGASLETKPGAYPLQLSGKTNGGREISFERRITVTRAKYPSIAVTVARKFTEPNPSQVQEIDKDKTIKTDAFAKISGERQWKGNFLAPVEARVSDVFGTRRTFNGKTQSLHQGLDYAVPSGTPVHALNAGTVLLAQPLYFEGNCVVLDHGQGLLTLYLHLSDFKVKEGDHVETGQEIGLSGGSGRATGPHLHIAVRWQGVYLNPATMLKLSVP